MIGTLLLATWRAWRDDQATRQGAALAFYAVFAAAPLLLVATAVLGMLFGEEAAQRELAVELEAIVTPEVAAALERAVLDAQRGGRLATGLGLLTTVWAGTRGFLHLQGTLNTVFGVRAVRGPGPLEILRRKALAFATIVVTGLLLLSSVVATGVLRAVAHHALTLLPHGVLLWRAANELLTLILITLLVAVVFRTLPDIRVRWRDVAVGAGVTAVLFAVGRHAMVLYVGEVAAHSAYGAAGSLVALLLFSYYSAQVVLFGAEFTWVYAERFGVPISPGPGAARVLRTTVQREPAVT